VKKVLMVTLSVVVLLSLNPSANGAGFLIYEHGAAAMAMGGAFIGLANNPTAIFHNPAGLAWLDGTQISLGTTLITSKSSLELPNWPDPTYQTVDQESQWFYPSTFYISHKFSDRITAGFGFFSPYGLGTKWPKDYPLKYIATKDDMKTFFFNPAVAIKLSEEFSLAFGVSYIRATLTFELVEHVDLADAIPGLPIGLLAYDVPITLKASGNGWGLNAGAMYKGENFSVGLNWRGGFKVKFDGDLDLDTSGVQIPAPYNQLIPAFPTEGTASTSFNFPQIFGLGFAFNLSQSVLFTADFHMVFWSCYDEFIVDVDVLGFKDKIVEEHWENSMLFRGGLQYNLNESFSLRVGALYDQTPQPEKYMDPILPDANRWAVTGGFGYKTGSFVINVAYQYEVFSDRTSPNRSILPYQVEVFPGTFINLGEGTYSNIAHLIGISLGYNF